MTRNEIVVHAPAEDVFSVLSDARNYGYFVVGTKRVRRFDPRWPEPGSKLHHTIGIGPFAHRDFTRSVSLDEPRSLVLLARMLPLWVQRIEFLIDSQDGNARVAIEEAPASPLAERLWNPLFDRLLWLRNQALLRRLKKVTEAKKAQSSSIKTE